MMHKRWLVKPPQDNTTVEQFRSDIKTDAIIAELLLQRGITSFDEARFFFNPNIENLHSPFEMKNMNAAVAKLVEAVKNDQKILLYGDYDVDGTTAVSLLYNFLSKHSEKINFYIPDRYKEGYGLSQMGVEHTIHNNYDLIILLDCGTKALNLIDELREGGVEVIVCDHHTPGQELPNAILLNPKQDDCTYPFKELSGCGVGYKLLEGFCENEKLNKDELNNHLDLVAISIGADIVDITGENRILAAEGLNKLNGDPRPAFQSMIHLAGRNFPLSLTDVIFTIAPRINAAGRISSGNEAVDLLTSKDQTSIEKMSKRIQEYNDERRSLDEEITLEALEIINQDDRFESKNTTVVYKKGWHKGVIGIVASRLIEHHYRPTLVLAESDGLLTGSARSILGIDIHHVISNCGDLLERFGGHMYAAGLTIKKVNLEEFIVRFEKGVKDIASEELFTPQMEIDLEISFDQIFRVGEDRMKVPRLKRILTRFEPFGPGNDSPKFVAKEVYSTQVRILKEKHLKLSVTQASSDVVLEAIGFNLADKADLVSSGVPFDMVFTLDINKWNSRETLQLNIRDIREH